MGTTNVMIWIEVEDEDESLDVSEQLSDLIEANVVRLGVRLKGVTQERPKAACGLSCEGPRRLQGAIEGTPTSDIYLLTPGGQRIGILQFLREDGNREVDGRTIVVESTLQAANCSTCTL